MGKKATGGESEVSERDAQIRSAFSADLRRKAGPEAEGKPQRKGPARKAPIVPSNGEEQRVAAGENRAAGRVDASARPREAKAHETKAQETKAHETTAQETKPRETKPRETKTDEAQPPELGAKTEQHSPRPNFDELAANFGRLADEAARATNAYIKPLVGASPSNLLSVEVTEMARTLGKVAETWLAEPQRAIEAQTRLTGGFIGLWADALRRFQGQEPETAQPKDPGQERDSRFKDPAWRENPFFDFLRQSYAHATRWAEEMVNEAKGIDPHTRHKAEFYVRQLAGAFAPSNFLALNPELIRQTIEQNGANLVRGAQMLAEDVEAGQGELRLRQTDSSTFEVGVNLATTPGEVVFRNDLMELIQYAPSTTTALRRPLLIVPPWINKFYILDLTPDRSFIRWAVSQGLTVFVISWVNPDARHADKSFDAYMKEGIFAALDAIKAATGEEKVAAVGYCVGGTLLGTTLGYMAAKGDRRIESATLLTTQVDFKHSGDLQVFVDEDQIRAIENEMGKRGFLDGKLMATAFNMLRPNDLIWRYVVDVYLKGKSPMPFDLLFWNSDSTRMPAANHSFYMRNCYLENNLSQARMALDGVTIDLRKVTIPIYDLATKEDHIAPALSAFEGSLAFGGDVRFVMAGSGHIAGVVNPPAKERYQYWADGPAGKSFTDWVAGATEHKGSWWSDWFSWLERQAPDRVPARAPGGGKLVPLCPAPGTYVKVRT
jgi:polyhydroxyalkanoate synthase